MYMAEAKGYVACKHLCDLKMSLQQLDYIYMNCGFTCYDN